MFVGYREELYTRRVIKESRDEYLKMRRESRGIKRRLRVKGNGLLDNDCVMIIARLTRTVLIMMTTSVDYLIKVNVKMITIIMMK